MIRPRSWVISGTCHLILLGALGLVALLSPPREPQPLRISFSLTSATAPGEHPATGLPSLALPQEAPSRDVPAPAGAPSPRSAVVPPLWQGRGAAAPSPVTPVEPSWTSADLLLPDEGDKKNSPQEPSPSGWTLSSDGQAQADLPPPPPAQLLPPDGSQWDLVFSIPGPGGFPLSIGGNDSGRAELDRWLADYLKTLTFPPSLDGQPYQVRWKLRLKVGRPE